MNRRTLKHDREDIIRQARAVIAADSGSKFTYMATVMLFYLSGKMSLSELSEVGVSERMASAWLKKAGKNGIEALRDALRAGNPSRRSDAPTRLQLNEHRRRKSSLACEKRAK